MLFLIFETNVPFAFVDDLLSPLFTPALLCLRSRMRIDCVVTVAFVLADADVASNVLESGIIDCMRV